ncbi:hypothetical protein [Lacrimispora sp.]|uniref:hypothetical protein n=1 Tax=Lacrimispora sp. TaxID=2719234 RepID=UPI0028A8F378|nr:hypothetical protein [Lacrimispora sp.]
MNPYLRIHRCGRQCSGLHYTGRNIHHKSGNGYGGIKPNSGRCYNHYTESKCGRRK